jgi:monofunctional chorismate mutase
MVMGLRGVRGATTCDRDDRQAIHEATWELLAAMQEANQMAAEDVAALFFSLTRDLVSAVPAAAARQMGYRHVPMMDLQEADGGPDLERCIRVLALWNTDRSAREVRHVYLRGAATLRPDLGVAVWS